MAATAPNPPPVPVVQQRPYGPGELAIQRGADQIIALFEQDMRIAMSQRDETINRLTRELHVYRKAVSSQGEKAVEQLSQQLKSDQPHGPTNVSNPSETLLLHGTVNALRQENAKLHTDLKSYKDAISQMGIHSSQLGVYNFSEQWVELFNELGIKAGNPWTPDQLLAVIKATAERLRSHRQDLPPNPDPPQPSYSDPFVLQTELNRIRSYLAYLESMQTPPTQQTTTGPSG